MEFPDWSPRELRSYYYWIGYKSADPDSELLFFASPIGKEILLAILTNPDMETVWNAFNKDKAFFYNAASPVSCFSLVLDCMS